MITLLSGTFDSEIRCKFDSVSLDDKPSFIALSYCWSESKSHNHILMNGRAVFGRYELGAGVEDMRHVDVDIIF